MGEADLPVGVDIKFDLYTLACRELLSRLGTIRALAQNDNRLHFESCTCRFDNVLQDFLTARVINKEHATARFLELLRPQISLMRDLNEDIAEVFDAIATAVESNAHSWRFQDDFEALHEQGRGIATRFYSASPHEVTRDRLARAPILEFRFEGSDYSDADEHKETFGYGVTPAGFHPKREVVVIRLTFRHDFGLYLAYPFIFLHEYTSHIYGTDHGNQRFNEGWMLHAAEEFLKGDGQAACDSDQLDVFTAHLYPRLNPIPRRTCQSLRPFHAWLEPRAEGQFQVLTYELAAFQPDGRPRSWPDRFINALLAEFDVDRSRPPHAQRLAHAIVAANSAHELSKILPCM